MSARSGEAAAEHCRRRRGLTLHATLAEDRGARCGLARLRVGLVVVSHGVVLTGVGKGGSRCCRGYEEHAGGNACDKLHFIFSQIVDDGELVPFQKQRSWGSKEAATATKRSRRIFRGSLIPLAR
jgi:hypothetical protein